MSILVVGTVAFDTVKTPAGVRRGLLGGSAAHFSMAARLFTRVNLAAVVGADFPARHRSFLARRGIGLASLVSASGATFRWDGEYEGAMNSARTLKTQLGVLADFQPYIAPVDRSPRILFLANVDPLLQLAFLKKLKRPFLVGLDSMNFWIHTKPAAVRAIIKEVDIFVANEQEAQDLTGSQNVTRAAKKLCSWGPSLVLIKRGEYGAMLYGPACQLLLPAFPVERVIDPTGAGDTFAGGFFGTLASARRLSRPVLREALLRATVAASFNVEGFGLERTARLDKKQLCRRLALLRGMIEP